MNAQEKLRTCPICKAEYPDNDMATECWTWDEFEGAWICLECAAEKERQKKNRLIRRLGGMTE